MPLCTCPSCGRTHGVAIRREHTYDQWLAKLAPETKPGEAAPRVPCFDCWRHEQPERQGRDSGK